MCACMHLRNQCFEEGHMEGFGGREGEEEAWDDITI